MRTNLYLPAVARTDIVDVHLLLQFLTFVLSTILLVSVGS